MCSWYPPGPPADPVKKHGQGRQVLAHSLTHLRHGTRAQVGSSIRLHAQGPSLRPCRLGRLRAGSALCYPHSSRAPITGPAGQHQHSIQAAKAGRTGLASANTRKVGVPTTLAAAASSYSRRHTLLRSLYFTGCPEPATPLRKMPVSG